MIALLLGLGFAVVPMEGGPGGGTALLGSPLGGSSPTAIAPARSPDAASLNLTVTLSTNSTTNVTVVESGLSSGTSWSIGITGSGGFHRTANTTASSIVFYLPDGLYTYRAAVPTGYASNDSNGTFMVAHVPVTVSITYSSASSGTANWAFPLWFWGLLGVVAALASVAVGRLLRPSRRSARPGSPDAVPLSSPSSSPDVPPSSAAPPSPGHTSYPA